MLRILVLVTFNPGWGWMTFARFDLRSPGGVGALRPVVLPV